MFHIVIQCQYWFWFIEWLKVYSYLQDVFPFMIQKNEFYGANFLASHFKSRFCLKRMPVQLLPSPLPAIQKQFKLCIILHMVAMFSIQINSPSSFIIWESSQNRRKMSTAEQPQHGAHNHSLIPGIGDHLGLATGHVGIKSTATLFGKAYRHQVEARMIRSPWFISCPVTYVVSDNLPHNSF